MYSGITCNRWYICAIIVNMYVATVPNRNSPPAILLRESYRENGRVKSRTLANLTHWSPLKVEALRSVLKSGEPVFNSTSLKDAFIVERSLPHGHIAAVLGTMESLGFDELLNGLELRDQRLIKAIIAAQIISPSSKFAISRGLRSETATSSLGEILKISHSDEDDLYRVMDSVMEIKGDIEAKLADHHLKKATLVLYDVSTAALEGRLCPLGAIGHPKDGVKGRLQIVYGLLTSTDGIPIAIEVFKGNTADPNTLSVQIEKLKERFKINNVAIVADRGMLTSARLDEEVIPAGLDYITALRSYQIKNLVIDGAVQLSLFDTVDLFETSHPDYPNERLIACKNPFLAEERTRKRDELLNATELKLKEISEATRRTKRPLKGKDMIGLRVGKVIGKYKMAKHFIIQITEDSFSYERNIESIKAEAVLDGMYVIRTSLDDKSIAKEEIVSSYKALANVERAFRDINTELDIRPIRHRLEDRVRAHVFLRMLSYYVSFHMKKRLAPILFKDDDKKGAEALRTTPVEPAKRSKSADSKAGRKKTDKSEGNLPVQSFTSLLKDLATITVNKIVPKDKTETDFSIITNLTPLQSKAFQLLQVSHRFGYM